MRAYDIDKGSAFQVPRVTVSATTPPVTFDQTQGVSVGDIWVNTAGPTAYICSSVATGAATWTRFNAS
jgi:hypothetical protein